MTKLYIRSIWGSPIVRNLYHCILRHLLSPHNLTISPLPVPRCPIGIFWPNRWFFHISVRHGHSVYQWQLLLITFTGRESGRCYFAPHVLSASIIPYSFLLAYTPDETYLYSESILQTLGRLDCEHVSPEPRHVVHRRKPSPCDVMTSDFPLYAYSLSLCRSQDKPQGSGLGRWMVR